MPGLFLAPLLREAVRVPAGGALVLVLPLDTWPARAAPSLIPDPSGVLAAVGQSHFPAVTFPARATHTHKQLVGVLIKTELILI